MASRVEDDPNVVLWLVFGESSAERNGVVDGGGQIVDLEIQVHGDSWGTVCSRPLRAAEP